VGIIRSDAGYIVQEEREVKSMLEGQGEQLHGGENRRERYYVSVQAGQILTDPEAAAYELDIMANEEEVSRLREMFEELSSMDEAATAHFSRTFNETDHDEMINGASDEIITRIYRLLYECGTEGTRRHIASMGLL
jgi:hypothetical protein